MLRHRLMEEVKSDDTPPPTDGGAVTETKPDDVATPPAVDKDEVDSSEDLSEFVNEDLGDEDVDVPQRPAPKPAEPKVETPPKTAAEEVKPSQPQQPVPTPTPEPETKPTETPPPAAAQPVPTPTEEERKATYEKDRAAAFAKLTERYAVPEDQVAPLVTEPERVIPAMLAKVHAEVMENVVAWVQQALPQMIEQTSTATTTRTQAVQKFYTEWPELNKPEHAPVVARVLAGYRQANPEAKPEDVIREGGVAALVALRLPIPERVLKQNNAAQPDAKLPSGFAPTPRVGVARPPAKPDTNVFSVIAEEDLQEGA
jgi:hypothetical protein